MSAFVDTTASLQERHLDVPNGSKVAEYGDVIMQFLGTLPRRFSIPYQLTLIILPMQQIHVTANMFINRY